MTEASDIRARKLIDKLTPDPRWGSMRGVFSTTYELGPDFFEMDFLPSVLGLGTWDDRSWTTRIALEKHLSQLDAAVILTDARRYRGRPRSLRVEIQPTLMPRGSALHAKVTILLFERAVRLIVGSANLTERGYRRNREVVSILTATQDSKKDSAIISQALIGTTQALNPWLTGAARKLLADSLDTLRPWMNGNEDPNTSFLWTHGQTKLWREFLDWWPSEDTIKRLTIISPFWSENAGSTLCALLKEADKMGALGHDAEVRLLTDAFQGPNGEILPILPPGYASYDWSVLGVRATAQAVSPKVLPEELGGMEGFTGSRDLHAKVVLIEGSKNAIAYLGSANFTVHGWGFLDGGQATPNVEAGLIIRRSIQSRALDRLIPDLVGNPVPLTNGNFQSLKAPEQGPDDDPWPEFIREVLLSPKGLDDDELELVIEVDRAGTQVPWCAKLLDREGFPGELLIRIETIIEGSVRLPLSPQVLTRLLTDQEIQICWKECPRGRAIPINVEASARLRLPVSPGRQSIKEADLLFYYQGRISWEELFPDPDVGPGQTNNPAVPATPQVGVDTSQIQSYQIREFVEALAGIRQDLAGATQSDASMRLALLGPVSPLALAQRVRDAVDSGSRTPMAGAFQLVEILACLKSARAYSVPERLAEAWDRNLKDAARKISSILKQLIDANGEPFDSKSFNRYQNTVLAGGMRPNA
jgi:phosphatidylserine/phosphatidylglycerophosphate/cardiolipin synthase-like enzyme